MTSLVNSPIKIMVIHIKMIQNTPGQQSCLFQRIVKYQCVANIQIFKYIRIFIDKYIHLPKYLWIFQEQINSDIHSRLFSPPEYIRTFIRIVRLQQRHSNKAAQKQQLLFFIFFQQFYISVIDMKILTLVLIPYLIFTIHLYSFAIIFGQYFSVEYICIFIFEYTTWTSIFRHSFVKIQTIDYIWTFIHE